MQLCQMSFTQKIQLETRICTEAELRTPSDRVVSWLQLTQPTDLPSWPTEATKYNKWRSWWCLLSPSLQWVMTLERSIKPSAANAYSTQLCSLFTSRMWHCVTNLMYFHLGNSRQLKRSCLKYVRDFEHHTISKMWTRMRFISGHSKKADSSNLERNMLLIFFELNFQMGLKTLVGLIRGFSINVVIQTKTWRLRLLKTSE